MTEIRFGFSKERGKKDPKTPQLTIFYDGKIFVFDDYPTERARDLVSMAKKGSSKMSYGILSSTFGQNPTNSCRGSTSSSREGLPPRPHNCTSSDKHVTTTHNTFKQNTKPSTIEPISTSTRAKEPRSPQTTDADSSGNCVHFNDNDCSYSKATLDLYNYLSDCLCIGFVLI